MIAMRWTQSSLSLLVALTLLAVLAAPDALDAKRKQRAYRPPLRIVNVTPSPVPFLPGHGSSLSLAVTVELPRDFNETDVLEVSSLISFPSKRSIRFLYDRQPLHDVAMENGRPRKQITLLWDGRDQNHQYVNPGEYAYAIRAKLMAEFSGFMKAKTVSLFARGTLDVSAPPADAEPEAAVARPTLADAPPHAPGSPSPRPSPRGRKSSAFAGQPPAFAEPAPGPPPPSLNPGFLLSQE